MSERRPLGRGAKGLLLVALVPIAGGGVFAARALIEKRRRDPIVALCEDRSTTPCPLDYWAWGAKTAPSSSRCSRSRRC